MATIHRTIRDDGICLLMLDRAGSSANVFDPATLEELRNELDFIESQSGTLKGVILASAKRSIFIAGLDLKAIGESASAAHILGTPARSKSAPPKERDLIARCRSSPIPTPVLFQKA